MRITLSSSGPPAVLALLWGPEGPDWGTMARGDLWLHAAAQVCYPADIFAPAPVPTPAPAPDPAPAPAAPSPR